MKYSKHIFLTRSVLACVVTAVLITGCDILDVEDRPDPNNSELNQMINNPTRSDVSTLVTGTESGLRTELRIFHINMGMIGREMYRFLSAEPRNTADLLGKGNAQLDAGSFYITRPWASFYTVIRNANILIQASTTLNENGVFSDEEHNGVLGFANTMKAYQYQMALNLTYENGIREQPESDFASTGPLLSRTDSEALINSLLDEAAGNLENAGDAFPFTLSEGLADFNNPESFRQFNRALRARVAVYQEDWEGALTEYLPESFIDEDAPLGFGAYHTFSTSTNDILNPVFSDPQAGSGDSWVAHNSWVEDAETGDERVDEKVQLREETASLDGLSSDYGLFVYQSQTAPMPIIRNAELLLIRAEALAQRNNAGDLQDAEDDLNVIRNAAGLADFSSGLLIGSQEDVIDEMLNQRRYELFFEGHRWIDMRRYGRLDELPLDREGDNVWTSFPIPENENI